VARSFRRGLARRAADTFVGGLLRAGISPGGARILVTRGRRTGRPLETPVNPIEHDDERWLVACYGIRSWVLNARATGRVELKKGRQVEPFRVEEVPPATGAPVLKEYLRQVPFVRPYFDVPHDAPARRFEPLIRTHPVFRLVPEDA
jgi:deazaflavin-dependent oxidoreductase (nitroreductase family)